MHHWEKVSNLLNLLIKMVAFESMTFSFRTAEGANEVSLKGSARALETIRQACR
jgi:hypothetical protein